ncbi:Cullin [Lipomyces oligophaga]|uniref:Cullin n=1 Tax=Lipomyces oligophaga TaxID=45792 RepID=UPI0034CD4DC4
MSQDSLNQTWSIVQVGIDKILAKNLEEGLTSELYMKIYTAIYQFCTAAQPSTHVSPHSSARGAQLLGADLYDKLIEYLNQHLNKIRAEGEQYSEEALIKYYIRMWNRYTTGARYLNHIFEYLNRHWVRRERDEGRRTVYDVNTLCLVKWRSEVFDHTQARLTQAVLHMIENQRNGETIDIFTIRFVIASYVSLGLDEHDSRKVSLSVYKQYFEVPFITCTEEYYDKESATFISENSTVEYLKKAESRLKEEAERVHSYLHQSTDKLLMRTCETSLIGNHAKLLQDQFLNLLEADRQDDLKRMTELLAHIPDGLVPLRATFETYVRQQGLDAVVKLDSTVGDTLEPKAYVDTLLEVYRQYSHLVKYSFGSDADFVKTLDNACREFINRNQVTKNSLSKSPELLARYCDLFLKKSGKAAEDTDVEAKLTDIMTIFKFIDDKDVFNTYYSRMLSRRLVGGTSASEDAESSMISKLQEVCGTDYTLKLQSMFTDIRTSQDMQPEFREYLSQESPETSIDFSILVLSANHWPLSPPDTTFNVPDELVKPYQLFPKFYDTKHESRKLNWLWQHSKGELKVNYAKGVSRVGHTFQVSTYQMAILLPFNRADSYSYEQLHQITGLTRDVLVGSLTPLVKARVLTLEGGTLGGPGTKYTLNMDFKNKKVRINLNVPIRSEQRQETEATNKTIDEDRKMLMQSVIVRIMKARKVLKHVVLVQETIAQIKTRFTPKIPEIKKCIDFLIEKEYIERIEGDKYAYLA